MILQLDIWQEASGIYKVASTQNLGKSSGAYWMVARGLDVSPCNYLKWVFKKHRPSYINYGKNCNYVSYGWDSEADARKFKNEVNKMLREKRIDLPLE